MKKLYVNNAQAFQDLTFLMHLAKALLCRDRTKPSQESDAVSNWEILSDYFDIAEDIKFRRELKIRDNVSDIKLVALEMATMARIAANPVLGFLAMRMMKKTQSAALEEAKIWVHENPAAIKLAVKDRVFNALCLYGDYTDLEVVKLKELIVSK